jgi:phosphoglycerate dehydrogenase-like enzyme
MAGIQPNDDSPPWFAHPVKAHILMPTQRFSMGRLLERLDPAVEVTSGRDIPQPADFHILVAGRPTREQLAASSRLQALIIPWAGLPETTRELLADFPQVTVHNLHHNAVQTAEMALALLFCAARYILPADRQLRQGEWTIRYEPPPVMILEGKTALIVGFGAIGQQVARICQALGMQVRALRRSPTPAGAPDIDCEVFPSGQLQDLLPEANALVITVPLTEATQDLIGEEELALLPDESVLINVGRGPIVNEAALYQGLLRGRPRAAGLDVWYNYPDDEAARTNTFPSQFPFHELDNVVLSPHRGGAFGSSYTEEARVDSLAELFNAAARSQPMPNQIDLQAGY